MTTETDDLSYYEHDLPKIIAAVRRGEKWEYQASGDWIRPSDQSMEELEGFLREVYRVRLAPVPVVRPWSEPADVPGPVCWIRVKAVPNEWSLVTGIDSRGIYTLTETYRWAEIPNLEHSTDRIHWSPCVKPEGGK